MKISVLAGPGASTAVLLNWLLKNEYHDLDLILEGRPGRWMQLRQRARREGWSRAVGQALFMAVIVPVLRKESATRRLELLKMHGLSDQLPSLTNRLEVPNINDSATIERLKARDPDIVLVNGTRILRAPVLSAVFAPFINAHAGLTPDYRGVHGGYWALRNDEPEKFGATLHLVDVGVDTGGILEQVTASPATSDNFASYPLLQQAAAFDALKKLLGTATEGGKLEPIAAPSGPGRQWTHPTAWDYLKGRLRGVR